jgi:hypothetical protein
LSTAVECSCATDINLNTYPIVVKVLKSCSIQKYLFHLNGVNQI